MRRTHMVVPMILLAALALAAAPAAHAQIIWGTSTAALSTDPGFEGYWKYCFDIHWDTNPLSGHALSHADVFLSLEECADACSPGRFAFADTAGSGDGDGGCTVYYTGAFLCEGDPHFPQFPFPTVKFEYYEGDCEPGSINSAHVCFYSHFIPSPPAVYPDALGIKFGLDTATGPLEGVLPICAVSPVQEATWGTLKSLYR